MAHPGGSASGARFLLYLPRLVATWDANTHGTHRTIDATVAFADVSGFTALSERLAQAGKVGAEQVTEIINGAFTELLNVARLEGGDLVSFGGDALLLMFSGPEHARRALTAADEMLAALDEYQRLRSPVPLAMSVGVASGPVTVVLAGTVQREVLLLGPTVDEMAGLEAAADAGEVLASPATFAAVEPHCRGMAKGEGYLLDEPPEPADGDDDDDDGFDDGFDDDDSDREAGAPDGVLAGIEAFVPASLRDELQLTGAEGEHRRTVVAFVRAQGVSDLLRSDGPDAVAYALTSLVDAVASAAHEHGVTLLASDVDRGGAKLILTAGVPAAVPDAEERMLRTARRIVETRGPIRLHVGVASGDVFAGDLGAAFRRAFTVMGDTVNLAARLAGTADVGQVITNAAVLELSRTVFDTTELDPVTLKGKAEPVVPIAVGRVVGASGSLGRSDVPLVGRERELATLREVVADVAAGRSVVVDLSGPVGIGKSRLLSELRREPGLRVHVGECEQYEQGTPYHVVRVLIRHLLDLADLDDPDTSATRLTEFVEREVPDLRPWLPLVALVVEVPVPLTPEVQALDPAFRPAKIAEVVTRLLGVLVDGPAVIGFDNTQWMDGASRDLVGALVGAAEDRPWVVGISRRDDSEAVVGGPHVLDVHPEALDPAAARALVIAASGDDPPPPHVIDEIVTRAAGNPLYVIELTASHRSGQLSASLERLLASRIDALNARDRRLLRYASVLGEQFELDLFVEALDSLAAGIDDPAALARLDEFLEVSALGRVRFRQALVRDVAYAGLAFGRRQEIHGLVAETIERRARHRAVRQAAVLSTHFEHAGRADKAWEYAVAGGARAAARYAHRDAVTLYERALRMADELPDLDPLQVAEAAEALGDAANLAGELTTADAAYVRAESAGSGARRSAIERKRGLLCEREGRYDDAIDFLERALEHAPADEPDQLADRVEAMVALAGVRYRQGRNVDAAAWCRDALAADPERREPAAAAHALQLLGLTDSDTEARVAHGTEALRIYEENGDHAGMAKVLNNLAIDVYYQGRWDEGADRYRRARDAAATAGDVVLTATIDNNLAEILSDQGRLDEAEALFGSALTIWRAARYRVGVAFATSNLGRLAARRGDLAAGAELLDRAYAEFTEMGATALATDTEVRRIEVAIAGGDVGAARERAERMLDDLGTGGDAEMSRITLLRLIGHACALDGDHARAAAQFRAAIDAGERVDARYEVALARLALGELGDADAAVAARADLAALGADAAVALPVR